MCTPFYEAVLDATGVTAGTRLLDVGCGGGFALLLAAGRGAVVSGLDAAAPLLDIARERVPGASFTTADLEEPLIYPDLATAVRTQLSSGPARNAIQHSRPSRRPRRAHPGVRRQPHARRDLPAGEHLPLPRRPGLTIRAVRHRRAGVQHVSGAALLMCRPGDRVALRYVTTTAVPLAVTISIEPFWPTVS
jgi:SAM-dependent methyltransferase